MLEDSPPPFHPLDLRRLHLSAAAGECYIFIMFSTADLPTVRRELLRISKDPAADLAEGALWIAGLETPDVARETYLAWLSDEAARARAAITDLDGPALLGVMRDQLGFRGDEDNYYDARNSCLDQVINRRRGIPITLSLVYLALASRAGEEACGINAPGHFLVRHRDLVVDPFQGEFLSTDDFAQHLARLGLPKPRQQAARLLQEPADNRMILVRMLTNLRGVYLRDEKFQQGLAVADLLAHLDPGNPVWRRDRGLLYRQLDCPDQAREDLEAYLASAPPSPDTETIRELLKSMEENPRVLH